MRKEKFRKFLGERISCPISLLAIEAESCPAEVSYLVTEFKSLQETEDDIFLLDDYGFGVVTWISNGKNYIYFPTQQEIYGIKVKNTTTFENWLLLQDQERFNIEKYMKLIFKFNQDPNSISFEEKSWVLLNCNCRTDLAPQSLLRKYSLSKKST